MRSSVPGIPLLAFCRHAVRGGRRRGQARCLPDAVRARPDRASGGHGDPQPVLRQQGRDIGELHLRRLGRAGGELGVRRG